MDRNTKPTPEDVIGLLTNHTRREALRFLAGADSGTVTVEELIDALAESGEEEWMAIILIHNHLPKLSEAGVIEWERARGEISYQHNQVIEEILELIEEESVDYLNWSS